MQIKDVRKDFLIYKDNPNLVYMDSGATSLKPKQVLDKMDEYYEKYGVNIHRGVYHLSYQATDEYDKARSIVASFINASDREVIFTRNATESLNLVALTYGEKYLSEGDEVITSFLDHHSCILPWMKLCERKGANLKYIALNSDGRITVDNFKKVLTDKTKIIAINYYSNVMGYRAPIEEIIKIAHEKVDVKKLDCDFLAFSSHKMFGPTGVGILYGKYEILKKLPPLLYGGDMNEDVNIDSVEVKEVPYRFEAGTPAIAEAIGLGEAITYIENIGFDYIHDYSMMLYNYTIEKLKDVKGITIYNRAPELPIIAFNIDGVHPHDAATLFDEEGICLRAGHHCAQLLTKWLKVNGTLRGSFSIYNTKGDCDKFVETVKHAVEFFQSVGF